MEELEMMTEGSEKLKVARAWKTEVKPNSRQVYFFDKFSAANRRTYNWAVEQIILRYEERLEQKKRNVPKEDLSKPLSKYDLTKRLTDVIRNQDDPLQLKDIPCVIREFSCEDAVLAFKHFFRRLKNKECSMKKWAKRELGREYGPRENWPDLDGVELWRRLEHFPRFKSYRDFKQSFRVRGALKSDGCFIKIPLVKEPIRLKEKGYLPNIPSADINTITISRSAGRWYAALQADWMLSLDEKRSGREKLFIDFDLPGVCRVYGSRGEEHHSYPRPYPSEIHASSEEGVITVPATDPLFQELSRLRYLSRKFSRRQYDLDTKQGSGRRGRTHLELQKFHAKIARRREYALHRLSTDLVRRSAEIHVRKPNLKALLEGKKNGEGLPYADAAWSSFILQLKYKSSWAGIVYEESAAE